MRRKGQYDKLEEENKGGGRGNGRGGRKGMEGVKVDDCQHSGSLDVPSGMLIHKETSYVYIIGGVTE